MIENKIETNYLIRSKLGGIFSLKKKKKLKPRNYFYSPQKKQNVVIKPSS